MERMIAMILRRFLGRAVNTGVDRLTRGGAEAPPMTREERQQAKAARQNAKKARQAMRMAKRLGRF